MHSFLNHSSINLCISSLSSFNNGYTFPFLSTNLSSHLLSFLLKIWVYLWNLWDTNFLASSLDFAAFFFSFQISYSFATFFTSIVLFFFSLFFFFSSFFYYFSSFFFFSSFLFSFSFCFYHTDFLCFGLQYLPHFFGHLVIFTFLVL